MAISWRRSTIFETQVKDLDDLRTEVAELKSKLNEAASKPSNSKKPGN